MNINFELKEQYRLILAAAQLTRIEQVQFLANATLMLLRTNYNYGSLLENAASLRYFHHPGYGIEEIKESLKFLANLGLMERTGGVGRPLAYKLTEEGSRIAGAIVDDRKVLMRPPAQTRTSVFVASAFGKMDVDLVYKTVLAPSIRDLGLTPLRIDEIEPFQTITERMLQEIHSCKILIADLSFARPSVYLEAGVAHGLGIPLILTCRKDHENSRNDAQRVHFDLVQYRISYWKSVNGSSIEWDPGMHPKHRLASYS